MTTCALLLTSGDQLLLTGGDQLLLTGCGATVDLRGFALAAITADTSQVLRRLDLYDTDGTTLLVEDLDVVDGNITVTSGAGSRRTATFTVHHDSGAQFVGAEQLWFGKVLKAWRGVVLHDRDDEEWWCQVGELVVEQVRTDHMPADLMQVVAADAMTLLGRAHFAAVALFGAGQPVETVVQDIAAYGGVSKFRVAATGRSLGADWSVEPSTSLADAIQQVCTDHGCEAYIAADGYLTVGVVADPVTSPTVHTFAGGDSGSLVGLTVARSGARLYNHVVVRGESSDRTVPAVWAEAENTEPSSPTRIYDPDHPDLGGIPRTTLTYVSPLITTTTQAQTTADALLTQRAILDLSASIVGLVIPWIDVGQVVAVEDPNPAAGEAAVSRWRLDSFPVPWAPGPVTYQASRVTRVG